MKRLAIVVALFVAAPLGAQPAEKPRAVEDMDVKMLGEVVKILKTDYDKAGKVVWLVESKGPAPFPQLFARFFDEDDVEYAALVVDFQHGSRVTGERTRASVSLPGGPGAWPNIKRIVIAGPVAAR